MADLIGLDFWRRLLTRVINSCLNKYFEQVETSQINNVSLLSYWGSNGIEVKVQKAKLKRDALVSLTSRTDFPLKINEGRLDTFEVQISDVKNAKARIILDGLYILLEPVDVRNAANDPDKIKKIQEGRKIGHSRIKSTLAELNDPNLNLRALLTSLSFSSVFSEITCR